MAYRPSGILNLPAVSGSASRFPTRLDPHGLQFRSINPELSGVCLRSGSVPETGAPAAMGVELTSDRGADGAYAIGETIRATLAFDAAVEVTGAPRLRLGLAMRTGVSGGPSNERWAVQIGAGAAQRISRSPSGRRRGRLGRGALRCSRISLGRSTTLPRTAAGRRAWITRARAGRSRSKRASRRGPLTGPSRWW